MLLDVPLIEHHLESLTLRNQTHVFELLKLPSA